MSSIPTRSIEELVARYTLEPELRDLYVEGHRDKDLFEWFFDQFNCDSISVFEIENIDIDYSLIAKYTLQDRNRDRIVALSLELERLLTVEVRFLTCVADSDFDFVLGRKHNSCYLLFTDYTGLDLYFCSEDVLEKIFKLHAPNISFSIQDFTEILQEIFIIRAANEKLDWGLHWIPFFKCCEIKDNKVVYDCEKFIRRYLCANSRINDLSKFIQACKQLKEIRVETPMKLIRSGDFFELIGWYMLKKLGGKGRKFRNPEFMRSILLSAIDSNKLVTEGLFKQLIKKYRRKR